MYQLSKAAAGSETSRAAARLLSIFKLRVKKKREKGNERERKKKNERKRERKRETKREGKGDGKRKREGGEGRRNGGERGKERERGKKTAGSAELGAVDFG